MKNLIIVAILTIFGSYKNNDSDSSNNFIIICYQKVEDGYHYSKDVFVYHSSIYRPTLSSEYINDSLVSVCLYKTEGKLNYSRTDIEADTVLFQMLNIPYERSIEITQNQLIDNGEIYYITELINDTIYYVKKDTLFLYLKK